MGEEKISESTGKGRSKAADAKKFVKDVAAVTKGKIDEHEKTAVAADIAVGAGKKGGDALKRGYGMSRDFFIQEKAWKATESTVESLKDAVLAQQALILDLADRVQRLEGGISTRDTDTR